MAKGKFSAFFLSGIIVIALAMGGYWLLERTRPENCSICQRGIHAQSRAIIVVNGKREPVCCARCAFTFQEQKHTPIRLVQVTDFVSARSLSPDAAFYVVGSRVVLCEKHEPLLDQTMHVYPRTFDRCEPSLYAFARQEDAEAFARENGGAVRSLSEVLQEVRSQP